MIKFCQNCKNNRHIEPGGANGYYWCWIDSVKICKTCGGEFQDIDFSASDLKILTQISQEVSFIEAMIKLKQNDIIEYNLKLSQFRTQVQQQEREMEQAKQQSVPHCPNCNSTNIRPISGLNRGASIAMFGIFSKKINKSFECLNCRYTW